MAKGKSKGHIKYLFTEEDFIKNNNKYEKRNIADETKRYNIIYGINRNVARHLASGYDGLKPVVRRILLVLYAKRSEGYIKVNTVAGDTMSKYHPHGDTAISKVIGNMGQAWNNNVLYITPSGNFGNEQGDPPAAGRYIKCKLSQFAYKCFFEDYAYASLDMKPTYTGKDEEPEYLPAKYPIALVNPQFASIGYGTAANIAPYNFQEVLEATLDLIKDPKREVNLIPDFPNGCDVIADKNLDTINTEHGVGKVTVRASIDIDHEKNVIIVRSLPLKVGTRSVISAIAKLVVDKKIEGIKDIADNTSPTNGVYLRIFLNKDTNPDEMLEELIKKDVGLQKTFGVQLKFIEDYKEYDFSPKEYLLNWLDFRREIVQSMHNRKYVELKQEDHMNEIKIFVFNKDNINKTIAITRKSKNQQEAIDKLVEEYKSIHMTSLQARTICGMRVYEFSKESYQKFLDRRAELKKEIAESEKIISNPKLIDKIIVEELEEGIKLFGSPRRSKIIYDKDKAKKVPDNKVIVAISKDGYVKKIDASKYSTVGVLGNTGSRETIVIAINNNKSLLVFDSNGMVSKVPVAGIPDMTPEDNGLEAVRYFKTTGQIVSVMEEIPGKTDSEILLVTKNGFVKKTPLSEFKSKKDLKSAITLNHKDELIATLMLHKDSTESIIFFTNLGNGIRFANKDIPTISASGKGKQMMTLKDDEEVAGVNKIAPTTKLILYVTSAGRAKITESKYFPVMNRKDDVVSLVPLTATEKLVSVAGVNKTDVITIHRKNSEPVTIKISDMKPAMRVAKAERVVKVGKGDIVIGISK